MEKFDDRYRIPSARLPKWDYGGRGTYFVTICTENRIHYFGEIVEYKMQLTEIGKIAWQEWKKIPELRPDMNIRLGAYVVMPNHFHGIICIGNNAKDTPIENNDCKDAMHRVSTFIGGNDDHSDAMHRVSTFVGGMTIIQVIWVHICTIKGNISLRFYC